MVSFKLRAMVGALAATALVASACAGGDSEAQGPNVNAPSPSESSAVAPAPSQATSAIDPAIVITPPTTMNLDQYFEFSYQEASTVGLNPEAAAIADGVLTSMTQPWVTEAVAENETQECMEGETQCGYFSLALEWMPCEADLLCVKQTLGKTGIGMATGGDFVSVVRIKPETGKDTSLDDFLGNVRASDFLSALNETATLIQKANDSYFEESPPRYDLKTLPSWLPASDGIHVWFPKYEVGPGALGIVEIVMREDEAGFRGEPTPPGEEDLITSYDTAYAFICESETDYLPRLTNRFADPYAVSALQMLLGDLTLDRSSPIYIGAVNGQYDFKTREAVKQWQSLMNIEVDGLVGPRTWATIQYQTCWHEEEAPHSSSGSQGSQSNQGPGADVVQVPLLVGLMNKDAQSVASRAGLGFMARAQGGDPSIAAQVNNGCVIVAQDPAPGALVSRGATVQGLMICPSTGQNAPGVPPSWSGPNMGGYTGPPPPPAWTGR